MKTGSIMVMDDNLVISYTKLGEPKKVCIPIESLITHIGNNVNIPKNNNVQCLHDSCPLCKGTGKKEDGSICIHHISCNCHKCTPR